MRAIRLKNLDKVYLWCSRNKVELTRAPIFLQQNLILYHVLRDKKPYGDLGADDFDQLDTARIQRHHVRRLEQLGYTVTLIPKEAA